MITKLKLFLLIAAIVPGICFASEYNENRAMVSWALYSQDEIIWKPIQELKLLFVGTESLGKVNPNKYFEPLVEAPLRISDEKDIRSFELNIKRALESVKDYENPHLIVFISSHGQGGTTVGTVDNYTAREYRKNLNVSVNYSIEHRDLINAIFGQIDVFERRYLKKITLDFIYSACFSNSIFPYVEARARTTDKGLYANGGAYRYDYRVNLLASSPESMEAGYNLSDDHGNLVNSIEKVLSRRKRKTDAEKDFTSCFSVYQLKDICIEKKWIYQPFWSSYRHLPENIMRLHYFGRPDLNSDQQVYTRLASANLFSQLGDNKSHMFAIEIITGLLENAYKRLAKVTYKSKLLADIARILVKIPSVQILPIVNDIVLKLEEIKQEVKELMRKDGEEFKSWDQTGPTSLTAFVIAKYVLRTIKWTGVALLNVGTKEAMDMLSLPICQEIKELTWLELKDNFEIGLAVNLTEYDEDKGLSYLKSFYEESEDDAIKEEIIKLLESYIPGNKAKILLSELKGESPPDIEISRRVENTPFVDELKSQHHIEKALQSSNDIILRASGAKALSLSGVCELDYKIKKIEELLDDRVDGIALIALDAIKRESFSKIQSILEKALKNKSSHIRMKTLNVISEQPLSKTLPLIKEALKDEDPSVANIAVDIIEKKASEEEMKGIFEVVVTDASYRHFIGNRDLVRRFAKMFYNKDQEEFRKTIKDLIKKCRWVGAETMVAISILIMPEETEDQREQKNKLAKKAKKKFRSKEALEMLKDYGK